MFLFCIYLHLIILMAERFFFSVAPDLDRASMSDIDMYSCKPFPIKTAAKLLHSQRLKELQQPWWKTFVKEDFEEYHDKKEKAEAEAQLESLEI